MELDEDLEHWMTNLPPSLKNISIKHLAIPGSHNSITYGITKKSKLSPDAEPVIKCLRFLGPILRYFMRKWAITITVNVTDQLQGGIRYLDFRFGTKDKDENFYFVHGLYSIEASEVLGQINKFLDAHPGEVIIIDCQHFYKFEHSDHERLMALVISTFDKKLVPFTHNMEELTLKYLTSKNSYQVVAIYRSNYANIGQPLLWPVSSFPTPWADTTSVTKLLRFLKDCLSVRDDSVGFVSQCVLTPSGTFIAKNLFHSLKKKCFLPLKPDMDVWIESKKPGPNGVNIIISDFVDYDEYFFTKQVIKLNKKLLSDLPQVRQFQLTPVDRVP